MIKVYWDLDGAIRGLGIDVLGHEPQTWSCKMPNGQDFCEYIDDHLDVLESAPATKYLEVAQNQPGLHIITHQPKLWRPPTMNWILKHLRGNVMSIKWVDKAEHKLLLLKPGDVLIEDNPRLPSYKQIVLIDWPYNRHIQDSIIRIDEPHKLQSFIDGLGIHELSPHDCKLSPDTRYYKTYCQENCDLFPCKSWRVLEAA
jgi:hypothetical protein